jgi:hypothetical protein
MSKRPPTKPDDLGPLLAHRQEAAKYELGRKPWNVAIGENLLILLDSPLRSTVTNLIGELAALVLLADARSGQNISEHRASAEIPIPSFKPVWAGKRLEQVNRRLWAESEAISAFNNRPWDPDNRRGFCDSCANPFSKEDICCRHGGRQLKTVDEL